MNKRQPSECWVLLATHDDGDSHVVECFWNESDAADAKEYNDREYTQYRHTYTLELIR